MKMITECTVHTAVVVGMQCCKISLSKSKMILPSFLPSFFCVRTDSLPSIRPNLFFRFLLTTLWRTLRRRRSRKEREWSPKHVIIIIAVDDFQCQIDDSHCFSRFPIRFFFRQRRRIIAVPSTSCGSTIIMSTGSPAVVVVVVVIEAKWGREHCLVSWLVYTQCWKSHK